MWHFARLLGSATTRLVVVLAVMLGGFGVATGGSASAAASTDVDALAIVNAYRAMSGLDPVTSNPDWAAQAEQHSCYMLLNGIAHDELPDRPGYTPGGDVAGNSGNVAVSSTATDGPREYVNLWMTAPFHAIGILRPALSRTAYGQCAGSESPTPWRSAATLDVVRGLDAASPTPANAVVFPGPGATVPLHRFVAETPNPVELCGWSGPAGLPLIAMMPDHVSVADAALTGPDGPIDTCVLHGPTVGGDVTAAAILDNANAVVVVPRTPLADGAHHATVTSDGGDADWNFTIDRDAVVQATPRSNSDDSAVVTETFELAEPARFTAVDPFRHADSRVPLRVRRLAAGEVTEVVVADPDTVAVSANFVAVSPTDRGYLTLYDCSTNRPTVSSVNYGRREVIANASVVPLQDGRMCLFSKRTTDIVVDVNGYYEPDGSAGFVAITPARVYDSRQDARLAARETREVRVVDGEVSADASAVVLSVVAITPNAAGHLRVYPCGSPTGANISSINYSAHDVRPNVVVTPTDGDGDVCVESLRPTDVAIDVTGYFADDAGDEFQALAPARLLDTRAGGGALNAVTGGRRVAAGATIRLPIAGTRGVPSDITAVSVNVTAVDALGATYLTVFPCGPRPDTSNVNLAAGAGAAASAAMVRLSPDGELCVYARAATHVIVDINGAWR